MLDILLINPVWKKRQGNIWKGVATCMPPLGLAQLAAYLEQNGMSVRIIDSNALQLSDSGLSLRIKEISDEFGGIRYIGITATTSLIGSALITAQLCKKVLPAVDVIMGGLHPTVMPQEVLLNSQVDYVIRGEGENAALKLIRGDDKNIINGLSYKNEGAVIHNEDNSDLLDLDSLPMPAYHLLPMSNYHPSLGGYRRLPAIGMMTTRGCPGKCTFCYGQFMGNRIRYRCAQKIIDEILFLQENYGIKEISFYDDTFTTIKKNIEKFCRIAADRQIDITWSCFSRVDFVNENLLKLMKNAGCHQICFGIESASQEILDNIKKKVSLEKAKNAIKLTRAAGIEARATFMLGNPGETEETIKKTLKLAVELKPDIALFNVTTPYPGTEMYKWAKENGYLDNEDWSGFDLSQPVMKLPTISEDKIRKFYKKAHMKFYCRPNYIIKKIFSMKDFTDFKVAFQAFNAILFNR